MNRNISFDELDRVFNPKSVAVIGVSRDPTKLGFQALKALVIGGFKGSIHPVHKSMDSIMGLKAYSNVKNIPEQVELAVIAVGVQDIPLIIEECVEAGVKGAVVFASGFKEVGDKGAKWQEEIAAIANRGNMIIIGPNTIGMINTYVNLSATFVAGLPMKQGAVGIISQSGGVSQIIINQFIDMNLGFSKLIAVGNRCNLEFADVLEYFRKDPYTKVIGMFIEGVDNARRLIDVARHTVKEKPVLVYKAGRTKSSPQAAYSHTGSLSGTYRIYSAAFKSGGMVEVDNITELVDTAYALTSLRLKPKDNKVFILTHTSGPSIIALDVLEMGGAVITSLSKETSERLVKVMPQGAPPVGNPLDVIGAGWVRPKLYVDVLDIVAGDDNVDIILVIYTTPSESFVQVPWREMTEKCRFHGKTLFVCLAHPISKPQAERSELEEGGIPVYPTPERAAKTIINVLKTMNLIKSPSGL